ncbi:MAG: M20/M25/M40 family metallo-hydrolase [Myxococcota bacterium]|nr:M20/M25/M40 family metallo-hydrolase [Myxococcota bacterium]
MIPSPGREPISAGVPRTRRPTRHLLVALCIGGSLAALCPPVARAIWPFGNGRIPDPAEDLRGAAATLLSRAIAIPTVNPPGDEKPLAEFMADVLKREKIETRVVETPAGDSRVGRAAVWARVPGTGRRPPVVLLSHLDVVPAEGSGWAVDPFEGMVVGGYVVGRGALDAKGVSVVHLLTLIELSRRDTPLSRDVIFLAVPDEETGGRDGAGHLVRRHKGLLHGAEFLLTEGGGILKGERGAPNIWGITVTEKAPCWTRLTARGRPGHGSTAGPNAAVPRLVSALERIRRMETEVRVVPEVARMFEALAPLDAPEDRAGLANLAEALESDWNFRRRFLANGPRAALVRNTIAITVLSAGARTNVVPAEAHADLDVRLLPGERCEVFAEQLRRVVADPEVEIQTTLSFEARASPADTALFDAIARVASELDPGAHVVPRVIAGFTDAHYFRQLGIVAYGFVPRWLPPNETRGIHGPNERISIENLARGVTTMVRILEVLSE